MALALCTQPAGQRPDPGTDRRVVLILLGHLEANRGYRRKRRVECLLAEAGEFDRLEAAAPEWQARSLRASADAVRRQAARDRAA